MKLLDLINLLEDFPNDSNLKFTLPGELEVVPVGLSYAIEHPLMPKRGDLSLIPDSAVLTITMEFENADS